MGEEEENVLNHLLLGAVILNYLNLKFEPYKPEGGEREYERHRTKFEAQSTQNGNTWTRPCCINICRFVSTSGTAENTLTEGNDKDERSFRRHVVHHLSWANLVSVEKNRYFNFILE